jgi:hypothetical protein
LLQPGSSKASIILLFLPLSKLTHFDSADSIYGFAA